jgi:hypothetical protein
VRRDGATITIKENPQATVKPSIVRFAKVWSVEPDTSHVRLIGARPHDRPLRIARHAADRTSEVKQYIMFTGRENSGRRWRRCSADPTAYAGFGRDQARGESSGRTRAAMARCLTTPAFSSSSACRKRRAELGRPMAARKRVLMSVADDRQSGRIADGVVRTAEPVDQR